jgi:predicted metal-dependent peptidase
MKEQNEMSEPMESMELTPAQIQKWGDTTSMMAWTAPGFRSIWYRLLANNEGKHIAIMSREVPVAATDGKNVIVNPDAYFEYPLQERTFIAAHEIVHNVYGDVELLHRCMRSGSVPMHDGTTLPFDMEVMQKSMDYRINPLLADSKIGKPPKDCLLDRKIAGANDSLLDVYKKVYEKKQDDGELPGGDFDTLLPPGKSTGQQPGNAAAQRNQQQWAVEVAAAQTIEQIRAQGKLAGALQRMFQEILQPEIPWSEHIRGIFNRRVGSGSYNWRRPDRRFIVRDLYLPSCSGHGAGWVVVWGDTSGSIGQGELCSYLAELGGIVEDVRPKRLTVLWCDSKIHRIDEIEEASDLQRIKHAGVGGRGGTAVIPVIDWIAAHAHEPPDMFVGFTDGYVTFPPTPPPYPVIWCSVADTKYPFGDVVRIRK